MVDAAKIKQISILGKDIAAHTHVCGVSNHPNLDRIILVWLAEPDSRFMHGQDKKISILKFAFTNNEPRNTLLSIP